MILTILVNLMVLVNVVTVVNVVILVQMVILVIQVNMVILSNVVKLVILLILMNFMILVNMGILVQILVQMYDAMLQRKEQIYNFVERCYLILLNLVVSFQNYANGGSGEVEELSGVLVASHCFQIDFFRYKYMFCLFQILKGPNTFIFLMLLLKRTKKGPRWQSSVNSLKMYACMY